MPFPPDAATIQARVRVFVSAAFFEMVTAFRIVYNTVINFIFQIENYRWLGMLLAAPGGRSLSSKSGK
jgi:hypothetical protein